MVAGHQELEFPREVRRVFQHPNTFVQSAHQDVVLLKIGPFDRFLQVPNSAVDDLGSGTGSRTSEVTRFEEYRPNPAQLRIQCTSRTGGSPANHAQIELLARNVFQFFRSAFHDRPWIKM
jgi:hypothetical protein